MRPGRIRLPRVWHWYQNAIIAPGKQPVFAALVAFIVTLIATRIIVRMIRAGRGPFGNVSSGDVHIHHVIPGIVLLSIGGLIGLASSRVGPLSLVGGLLFGMGGALVLDEFPLILHLEDVYWKNEGKLSVEATTLAVTVLVLALIVTRPNAGDYVPDEYESPGYQALGALLFTLLWVVPVMLTTLKGKIYTAALALVFFPAAYLGAIRLAKPGSPWATSRYADKPEKLAKAERRNQRNLTRVQPIKDFLARSIFGFSDASETPQLEGAGVSAAAESPTAPDADRR